MHPEAFAESDIKFFRRMLAEGYKPSVIYDIGASNASWSKAISDVLPQAQYHLFEPLASVNFSSYEVTLRRNLAANQQFVLHPVALGNQSGAIELSVTPDGYGTSAHSVAGLTKIKVPCWRLEEYVRANNLPPPQVLKMDVQGFEPHVLEGAAGLLATVDILMLETWLHRGYGANTPLLHEMIDALAPLGFVLTELAGPYVDDKRQLTAIDGYFLSKRLIEGLRTQKTA